MKDMRSAGRVNLLAIAFLAMLTLIIASFAFSREEPGSVGVQFMSALAKRDVDKLVELSYIGETDPAKVEAARQKLRKDWDFTVNTAGRYYTFAWTVSGATKASEDNASVTMKVQRNLASGGSYDEKYELPMEREGGRWRVNVGAISSEMYPGLPR